MENVNEAAKLIAQVLNTLKQTKSEVWNEEIELLQQALDKLSTGA